jgi:hypothetical protein
MTLKDHALSFLKVGYDDEAVRRELRGMIIGEGLSPTCSAVEEAIREAKSVMKPPIVRRMVMKVI